MKQMEHMRQRHLFAVSLFPLLLASCGGELPPGQGPEAATGKKDPAIPALHLFALKASNG